MAAKGDAAALTRCRTHTHTHIQMLKQHTHTRTRARTRTCALRFVGTPKMEATATTSLKRRKLSTSNSARVCVSERECLPCFVWVCAVCASVCKWVLEILYGRTKHISWKYWPTKPLTSCRLSLAPATTLTPLAVHTLHTPITHSSLPSCCCLSPKYTL